MKHTFTVEAHYPNDVTRSDGWLKLDEGTRDYCRGWLEARKDLRPRPAMRIVRDDGAVSETLPADDTARVGMVFGYPTGAQLIGAAVRSLRGVVARSGYVSDDEANQARAALFVLGGAK